MKKTILIFGGLAAGILMLFELSKYSIFNSSVSDDAFIAIAGLLFVGIGYLLSRFFIKKSSGNTRSIELDQKALTKIGLSNREYEIFELMALGQSNAEIGEKLFISESTVKTHVSNILVKLNAKRRTQAVQIGRDLNIIP